MQTAKDDGAFAPIDIDSLDVFPIRLCNFIVPWSVTTFKDSSSCVDFATVVQNHFPEEFTANILNMISVFDKLVDKMSFPPSFTSTLALVRYLLHRLSLSSSLDIDAQKSIEIALFKLWSYVMDGNLPDNQVATLSNLVEDIVIHSPVFNLKLGPEWTYSQFLLVKIYSEMVGPGSPPEHGLKHNFWPALRLLVGFCISQHDALYDVDDYLHATLKKICHILGFGLRHGVQIVYDIFLETRCLDAFGRYSLRPSLIGVINEYVTGLVAPHASIDSQQHLDYLHKPENIFLACCILATNGWNTFSERRIVESLPERLSEDIRRDIRVLVSLRPTDPSWEQCRRKFRDLLQDDGGEFFVKQQQWTRDGFKDLEPETIGEAKSKISFALDEFDGFFSDPGNMNVRFSMYPHESTVWHFFGRIYQYLRYPRRQERDKVQEV